MGDVTLNAVHEKKHHQIAEILFQEKREDGISDKIMELKRSVRMTRSRVEKHESTADLTSNSGEGQTNVTLGVKRA